MPTRAKHIDPITAAWMAGFVDGEGYIGITRAFDPRKPNGGRYYYKMNIQVGQAIIEPVKMFQEVFGGRIVHQKTKRGFWHWRLYGEPAIEAITVLLPYLRVKRKQAELVIEFQATQPGKSKGCYERITTERDAIRRSLWAAVCELNGGRAVRAERLNEEAPQKIEEDAIVQTSEKDNPKSQQETAGRLRVIA